MRKFLKMLIYLAVFITVAPLAIYGAVSIGPAEFRNQFLTGDNVIYLELTAWLGMGIGLVVIGIYGIMEALRIRKLASSTTDPHRD